MDNLRSTFLKVLISSIAISVVIGVIVVLFGSYEQGGKIFLTSLTVTVAAFSMFLNGIFFEKLLGKILPYAGFILTPLCALLCIAYIWDGIEEKPLLTVLVILGADFFMLPFAIFAERKSGRIIPIVGAIATLITAGYLILMIWDFRSDNDFNEKVAATAWALAITCFYLSLMLLVNLASKFRWSLIAVQIVSWAAFALGAYVIWFEPQGEVWQEWLGRLAIILSIFIAALTVLIPIFHFISRGEVTKPEDSIERIDAEIERLKAKIEALENEKQELLSKEE